jgi:hypothetical protein
VQADHVLDVALLALVLLLDAVELDLLRRLLAFQPAMRADRPSSSLTWSRSPFNSATRFVSFRISSARDSIFWSDV